MVIETNDFKLFFSATPNQVTQLNTVHICGLNNNLMALNLNQGVWLSVCSVDEKAVKKESYK
jgi:hypothetical protein